MREGVLPDSEQEMQRLLDRTKQEMSLLLCIVWIILVLNHNRYLIVFCSVMILCHLTKITREHSSWSELGAYIKKFFHEASEISHQTWACESVQHLLSWNSLCRPGCPWIQKSACLCFPSAGTALKENGTDNMLLRTSQCEPRYMKPEETILR